MATDNVNWAFAATVGSIDSALRVTASPDGKTWGSLSRAISTGWQTQLPLALAGFNDRVYMGTVGYTDYGIYVASASDGADWNRPDRLFGSLQTERSLALCAFNGKLYLAIVGFDNSINISSSADGVKWTDPKAAFDYWETSMAVSLAFFNGALYMAIVGKDGSINISSSKDGATWTSPVSVISEWSTSCPLALAANGDTLYLGIVGNDEFLYILSSSDGKQWSGATPILGGWQTAREFSLASSLDGQLLLGTLGLNGAMYTSLSKDGLNWDSPQPIVQGGQTNFMPFQVAVASLPAPTDDQIKKVQANLANMQTWNDYIHDFGQDRITNAYLLLTATDKSDPGLAAVISLISGTFSAVGAETGPLGAFIATFASGMVSWWLTDTPPSLNKSFATYLERFSASSVELDEQLATLSQNVADSWYTAFSFNGAGTSLSSLAGFNFPPKTDPTFEKLAKVALFALDQSIWTYVLVANCVVTEWEGYGPIILQGDPSQPPITWAQAFYAKNPAYYVTWSWVDSWPNKGWLITEYNVGTGAGVFHDGSISSAACGYLFIDSTPGTIINADGLFLRQQVFTGLGLKQTRAMLKERREAATPTGGGAAAEPRGHGSEARGSS